MASARALVSLVSRAGLAGLVGLASLGSLSACGASTGVPAAPAALESLLYDGGFEAAPADAPAAPSPIVSVLGTVRRGSDAAAAGAIVVASLGGLEAEGGAPTLSPNVSLRYGVVTNDAGAFSFGVPAGLVGLRVFDRSSLEATSLVRTAASPDAASTKSVVTLTPLPVVDGGPIGRPRATGLTISAASSNELVSYAVAAETVTFAVQVTSAPGDPLSEDVVLVQPTTGWAAALAPPTPAVAGGPYPDGVYSLLVTAPSTLGDFVYTLVVASKSGVPSEPVAVVLHVTATGTMPLFDAGGD